MSYIHHRPNPKKLRPSGVRFLKLWFVFYKNTFWSLFLLRHHMDREIELENESNNWWGRVSRYQNLNCLPEREFRSLPK